jgi:hypothetical protein
MAKIGGESEEATGTITSNTASLLTFANQQSYVIVGNTSGKIAYFKTNQVAGALTVSPTKRDFFLADGGQFIFDDCAISTMAVYVEATSGISVVGW